MRKLFPFLLIFPLTTQAWTLQSHTESNSTYFLERVQGFGLFSKEDDANVAFDTWNLSAAKSKTQTTDVNGVDTTLNSQEGTGGIGIEIEDHWRIAVGLLASSTSEVKYTNRGGSLSFGYEFDLGEPPASDPHAFTPSLTLTAQIGRSAMKQDFDFKVGANTVNRTFDLDQSSFGFNLDWDLASRWSTFVSATGYGYNKSKDDLATATHTKLSTLTINNLLSTIEAVPTTKFLIGGSFYPSPAWTITLSGWHTKMFVDDSVSRTAELDVKYKFNFGVILGGGVQATTEDSGNTQTALLDFGYRF